MTLSFTQTIGGKPNFFIEKIWFGLFKNNTVPDLMDLRDYRFAYHDKFGNDWDEWDWPAEDVGMKLHTIRDYRKNKEGYRAKKQWKAGDKIHPAINNRTKNYFQFAPTIECKSVQEIIIETSALPWEDYAVRVDDRYLSDDEIETLAINDGFECVHDFVIYFSKDVPRQLIHWTDLKY